MARPGWSIMNRSVHHFRKIRSLDWGWWSWCHWHQGGVDACGRFRIQ